VATVDKLFPNYLSAAAECGDGYCDADIAKVIAYRTSKWKDTHWEQETLWSDIATIPVLAVGIAGINLMARPLRVLDFGGGCGVHYFFARSALALSLKWAIVETPIMAEHAAQVSEGKFEAHDNIAPAVTSLGGVDLVFTSGAVQYTPDPLATLDALIAIGAPYFVLARFPFWTQTTIGIQQDPLSMHLQSFAPMPPRMADRTVKCPVTFVKYADVRSKFQQAYDCFLLYAAPSGNYQLRGQTILGGTLVYRRKDLAGAPTNV
jgi:putative methyltransferase (TIGR04325 family)